MSHEIWASVVIKLPEEPQAMAKQVAAFATAWAAMLEDVGEECLGGFSVTEAGVPQRQRGNGVVRRRKRKAAPLSEADARDAVERFPA